MTRSRESAPGTTPVISMNCNLAGDLLYHIAKSVSKLVSITVAVVMLAGPVAMLLLAPLSCCPPACDPVFKPESCCKVASLPVNATPAKLVIAPEMAVPGLAEVAASPHATLVAPPVREVCSISHTAFLQAPLRI